MLILKERKAAKILTHIVLNGETEQPAIPEIAGCSYRTALREIRKLEDAGLITYERVRRENTRGPPPYVWKATFTGILWVIGFHGSDIEKIIASNKNECVIFFEWDYISKINMDNSLLHTFVEVAAFTQIPYRSLHSRLTGPPARDEQERQRFGERHRVFDNHNKDQFSSKFLGIQDMICGVSLDSDLGRAFTYFMKNPNLKRFASYMFDTEEQKHQIMISLMDKLDIPSYSS